MKTLDIETTSLCPHTGRIVSLAIDDRYFLWNQIVDGSLNEEYICHNGSFDLKYLWSHGHTDARCGFDTLIAAYLLPNKPESLSLAECTRYYLGIDPSWKTVFNKDVLQMPPEVLKEYCLTDVRHTSALKGKLECALEEHGLTKFFGQLMKARHLLTQAEFKGMAVDWPALELLLSTLTTKAEELHAKLTKENQALIKAWQVTAINAKLQKLKHPERAVERYQANPPKFNWSSPSQVCYAIKRSGGNALIYDFKTKTEKESSGADVLERESHTIPWAKDLLEIRSAEKTGAMLSSYVEQRNPKTGRLHGNFNITVTRTGRLSSSAPNLQNIDKGPTIRSLFVPSSGKCFVIGDLAQIEVRMAAHYSRDPKLVEMFKRAEDFYGTIATEVLGTACEPNQVKSLFPADRACAKVIGLSILYGTGAKRLNAAIKKPIEYGGAGQDLGEGRCREIIKDYFRRFEGLNELRDRVEVAINKKGYIKNLFGRKLWIAQEDIYMNGVNYLLQSSASDLMVLRQTEFNPFKSYLIALVHDEFIREVDPEDASAVLTEGKGIFERTSDLGFRVPLKLDAKICNNWGEKA
jgi:DNA polymerase I